MNTHPIYLPKLLIFASGTADGGGSGAANLLRAQHKGILRADIVGVVSQHALGGVREYAWEMGVPFIHFPKPWSKESYQQIARDSGADFFALSGWLKFVCGLDPGTSFNAKTVFNIHPGPLPKFGGPGMFDHHVHEVVLAAYHRGEITHSAATMHFVVDGDGPIDGYDRGPKFFELLVPILPDDTTETLAQRVNACEHEWQPIVTDHVIHGDITWDGIHPASLKTLPEYLSATTM